MRLVREGCTPIPDKKAMFNICIQDNKTFLVRPVCDQMIPQDAQRAKLKVLVKSNLKRQSVIIITGKHHTRTGPSFNIKMSSYQYRESRCGDKTVVRSSNLHNGIFYIGNMATLYWISLLTLTFGLFAGRCWTGHHWCLSLFIWSEGNLTPDK